MSLPRLNTFAGNPLDRAGDRRNDPEWLAEQEANPEAVAMVLWQGRPLVEDHADGPRLAWLGLEHARAVVPDRELFLGLWKGAPVFAVEVESSLDPTAGPLASGSGTRGAFAEGTSSAAGRAQEALETALGSFRDGFERAIGDERDDIGEAFRDSRLMMQIGMLLGIVYLGFLSVWFWATRLREPSRSDAR